MSNLTISRNMREGYYAGKHHLGHRRGDENVALRRWPEHKPWTVDKSKFSPGPWHSEPDYQRINLTRGMQGVILRTSHSGALCGYVGVPFGHPLWGKHYTEERGESWVGSVMDVHGGITYSARGWRGAGESPRLWYFGFDCAHYRDTIPAYDHLGFSDEFSYYRDFEFVQQEVFRMAEQLAGILQ